VLKQWDQIKATERKRGPKQTGKFKDLPRQLPALMFAKDVYKQIEKQAMPVDGVIDSRAIATRAESMDEARLGEELFQIAAACRAKGVDPESALRSYTQQVVDTLEQA
jgi:XTP/dITP diphosphohydrolase/tetrapyrrole methylase family protein/MazG family protein